MKVGSKVIYQLPKSEGGAIVEATVMELMNRNSALGIRFKISAKQYVYRYVQWGDVFEPTKQEE